MKNDKPSMNFDREFGTSISQQYDFPFRLSADEVWNIIHETHPIFNDKDEFRNEKLKIVAMNTKFPGLNVNELTDRQQFHLLSGMASCYNSDDIKWFVSGRMGTHPESQKVKESMISVLGEEFVFFKIEWVVSPKTWKRIKEYMVLKWLEELVA